MTPTKLNSSRNLTPVTSFKSILKQNEAEDTVITVSFLFTLNYLLNNSCFKKTDGEKWIPIDWTLKTRLRFMSPKPFHWNKKLKTSEEASGITG